MQRVLLVFFFVVAVSASLFGDVVYHLSILIDHNLNDSITLVNLFPGNSTVSILNPGSGRRDVFTAQQRNSLGRKLALSPSAAARLGFSEGSIAEVRVVELSFSGEREVSAAAEYQDIVAGPLGADRVRATLQADEPSRLEPPQAREEIPQPTLPPPAVTPEGLYSEADGLPPVVSPPVAAPSSSPDESLLIDIDDERLRIPLPENNPDIEVSKPSSRPELPSSRPETAREELPEDNPNIKVSNPSSRPEFPSSSLEIPREEIPEDNPAIKVSNPSSRPEFPSSQPEISSSEIPEEEWTRGAPATLESVRLPEVPKSPRVTPEAPRVIYPPAEPDALSLRPQSLAQNSLRDTEPLSSDEGSRAQTMNPSANPRSTSREKLTTKEEALKSSSRPEEESLVGPKETLNYPRETLDYPEETRSRTKEALSRPDIYFPKAGDMIPPPASGEERIPGYDDISPSRPSDIVVDEPVSRSSGSNAGSRNNAGTRSNAGRSNDWGERSQGGNNSGFGVQNPEPKSDFELNKPEPDLEINEPEPKPDPKIDKPEPRSQVRVIGKLKTLDLPSGYYIQLASFRDVRKTRTIYERFVSEYKMNVVPAKINGKKYYRCLIGSLKESEVAEILRKVRSAGYTDAFVYKNF